MKYFYIKSYDAGFQEIKKKNIAMSAATKIKFIK